MRSGRAWLGITVHIEETIRVPVIFVCANRVKFSNFCEHFRFYLIYSSVFGTETISSDKWSIDTYFGPILVALFCQENVETSI